MSACRGAVAAALRRCTTVSSFFSSTSSPIPPPIRSFHLLTRSFLSSSHIAPSPSSSISFGVVPRIGFAAGGLEGSLVGGRPNVDRQIPLSSLTSVRHFAKRLKKWHGAPHVWLPIPPEGEQVPPSRPNQGSVKNRNHQKRMAQRAEFAKMQARTRKDQQRAANIVRDAARRKRWKEGAARAKAWAQVQAERAAASVALLA